MNDAGTGGGTARRSRAARRAFVVWPVLFAVVGLLGGLVLGMLSTPTYSARNVVQVQPQAAGGYLVDAQIGVLTDFGTPERSVQTAMALLSGDQTINDTATKVGGGWTPTTVRESLRLEPLGEANAFAVTAKAESAQQARMLTDAYTEIALERYNAPIKLAAEQRLQTVDAAADPALFAALEGAASNGDPSLVRVAAAADSAEPPPVKLLYPAAGAAAGLLAGFVLALIFDLRLAGDRSH